MARKRKLCGEEEEEEDPVKQYLAKKAQKMAMKAATKFQSQRPIMSGYSNDSNPFGDANLGQIFVWGKKIERDVVRGGIASIDEFSLKALKKRQKEKMEEMDKAKKRREERATERAQQEELRNWLGRERARAEFQDSEEKKTELEFYFRQSKTRSEIRLREGRAKPIDLLAKSIDGDFDGEVGKEPPYIEVMGNLRDVKEIEELLEDIKMHLDFDGAHKGYWEALLVVCEERLAEAKRKTREGGSDHNHHHHHGDTRFEKEVDLVLQGKSCDELEAFQSQVESDMRSGAAMVVEFWEDVVKRMPIFKARACLQEMHSQSLKGKEKKPCPEGGGGGVCHEKKKKKCTQEMMMMMSEDAGLEEQRAVLKATGDVVKEGDDMFHGVRKPKYFNRVHSGYEWNKYNRTHYEHDNPPPKIVQGYKFNIFFPDMVDKSVVPSYSIEEDGESAETCIVRFHAGPPYEDIAFRIVKREWEHSKKKGFRCTFEGGILRLYFNFKRHYYRR